MLVLVLVLVVRCDAWDHMQFTLVRHNGALACQIFIINDGRKIRESTGSRRVRNADFEISSAEALFGHWCMKVIICARATETTCQAVVSAY